VNSPSTHHLAELAERDPEIYDVTVRELRRQVEGLELIASENFASAAVMQATGTWLTNKYAEGFVGRRYYGGCEEVDVAEKLAIDRACALFGAEYANVQPHSGSGANMAVLAHVLDPGDSFLAMDLDAGGHLTHGAKVNFSGKLYHPICYGVRREDELLDYEGMEALAREHRPKLIIAGASAYARTIDFARFGAIAKEVGAKLLVDMAHIAGLVAAGVHPSPIPHADFVTTTTHKTLRGPRGGLILARAEYGKALDKAIFPGHQGGPLMHIIAAKAVAFKEAQAPGFRAYQAQIVQNARALGEALAAAGYRLVSGGTDNHLLLVDLRRQQLTGKLAEHALGEAHITVNKNKVPFDPQKPLITSGIRLGTPALTTRHMGEAQMRTVGQLIDRVLRDPENSDNLASVRRDVRQLANAFPLYPEWSAALLADPKAKI
jgi:glycine hydroxymethyltransferase